jgi:sulfonate transport system ATP-binding protein
MNQSLHFETAGATLVPETEVIARVRSRNRQAKQAGGGASLTIRGLSKAFGDNQVLENLDLHIPAGQFVAIVGPSGCGKSTLLRLIAGLETADAGSIVFGDETPPSAIRVMFQEPRLLPWARVLANVEVGLGKDRGHMDAEGRADRALAQVELTEKRNEWPAVLSGGQKQRVALARALVSRPRVLALDEPLGALDALTRITMQQLLEQVWTDQWFTAILVTHDVAEAVTLADRVIVLEEGRIAHDFEVALPRPRQRGAADVAALEGHILAKLLKQHPAA